MSDLQISVKTAGVTIPIYDEDPDGNPVKVGAVRFNPSNFDLIRRYEDVVKNLESIELPEGAGIDEFMAVGDKLKEQIDYLLGYNVSEEIFKICNPLTPTENGDFFVEVILENIADIIEKETTQRLSRKEARIKRATAKYQRKK